MVRKLDPNQTCRLGRKLYGNVSITTLAEELTGFRFNFKSKGMDLSNQKSRPSEDATFQRLNEIILKYPGPEFRTPQVQSELVKILRDKVKHTIFSQDMTNNSLPSSTVHEFILSLMSVREKIRGDFEGANRYTNQMHSNNTNNNNNNDNGADINFAQNERQRFENRPNHNKSNNNYNKPNPCYICGRNTHPTRGCPLVEHPDRNQEIGIPFKDSTQGRLWKSNDNGGPYGLLHNNLRLDGTPYHRAGDQNGTPYHRAGDQNQQRREEGKPPSITLLASKVNSIIPSPVKTHSDFLTVVITLLHPEAIARGTEEILREGEMDVVEEVTKAVAEVTQIRAEEDTKAEAAVASTPNTITETKEVTALLDTGCLVGDCISQESINSLNAFNYLFDTNTTICSGFDNTCETKFKSLDLNISFINELNLFKENFNTTVTVLRKSKIDLIIGRETIKKYNLSKRLPSHFEAPIKLTDARLIKEAFADT